MSRNATQSDSTAPNSNSDSDRDSTAPPAERLTSLHEIGPVRSERLVRAGYHCREAVLTASHDELAQHVPDRVATILVNLGDLLGVSDDDVPADPHSSTTATADSDEPMADSTDTADDSCTDSVAVIASDTYLDAHDPAEVALDLANALTEVGYAITPGRTPDRLRLVDDMGGGELFHAVRSWNSKVDDGLLLQASSIRTKWNSIIVDNSRRPDEEVSPRYDDADWDDLSAHYWNQAPHDRDRRLLEGVDALVVLGRPAWSTSTVAEAKDRVIPTTRVQEPSTDVSDDRDVSAIPDRPEELSAEERDRLTA